jgi:hypothetical protein
VGLLLIGLLQNKIFKARGAKKVLMEMILENDWGEFENGEDLSKRIGIQSITDIPSYMKLRFYRSCR